MFCSRTKLKIPTTLHCTCSVHMSVWSWPEWVNIASSVGRRTPYRKRLDLAGLDLPGPRGRDNILARLTHRSVTVVPPPPSIPDGWFWFWSCTSSELWMSAGQPNTPDGWWLINLQIDECESPAAPTDGRLRERRTSPVMPAGVG